MANELNIPSKSLEDNFKLSDFQGDFTELLKLVLKANAAPKKIDFTRMNELDVVLDSGDLIQYRFEKNESGQISKIINLTDNKETIIIW